MYRGHLTPDLLSLACSASSQNHAPNNMVTSMGRSALDMGRRTAGLLPAILPMLRVVGRQPAAGHWEAPASDSANSLCPSPSHTFFSFLLIFNVLAASRQAVRIIPGKMPLSCPHTGRVLSLAFTVCDHFPCQPFSMALLPGRGKAEYGGPSPSEQG